MTIENRYDAAFERAVEVLGEGSLVVPTAASTAAAQLLPVSGCSITITRGKLRIPRGASDTTAALAESLQFTAGDGPCLQAGRHDLVLDTPMHVLINRFPLLWDLWSSRTPYRSAASVPLPIPGSTGGALNLFFDHEAGGRVLDLVYLRQVTGLTAGALRKWSRARDLTVSDLASSPLAGGRGQVWTAVGIVMKHAKTTAVDALAMIRSWSYGQDLSVDETARRLTTGELDPAAVLD